MDYPQYDFNDLRRFCYKSAKKIYGVYKLYECEEKTTIDRCNPLLDYCASGRTSSCQFTHIRDANGTTSWLDHVICSSNMKNKVLQSQITKFISLNYIRYI